MFIAFRTLIAVSVRYSRLGSSLSCRLSPRTPLTSEPDVVVDAAVAILDDVDLVVAVERQVVRVGEHDPVS
jgi:hypothetical protein